MPGAQQRKREMRQVTSKEVVQTHKRLDNRDPQIYSARTRLLLSYDITTDVANGSTIPGATWHDVHSAQNFTKELDATLLWVVVIAAAISDTANISLAGAVLADSTRTTISGDYSYAGGANFFAGASQAIMPNIPAGPHTIKTQIFSNVTATYFLEPATNPANFFNLKVLEIG